MVKQPTESLVTDGLLPFAKWIVELLPNARDRTVANALVPPERGIVINIRSDEKVIVFPAEHNEMAEALGFDQLDPSFDLGVSVRCLGSGGNYSDAGLLQHRIKFGNKHGNKFFAPTAFVASHLVTGGGKFHTLAVAPSDID